MLRVGIFFGGPSREREISFAGGRTVFDNLDKTLFAPVPVFVDSLGNFIRLQWPYLYKGTIRDFFPPPAALPVTTPPWQVYLESLQPLTHHQQDELARAVGEPIQPRDFASLFDFAFLTLHGPAGEDGAIQGLLDWYGLPYSGAGILPSAIGIDKVAQKQLLRRLGWPTPDFRLISLDQWQRRAERPALLRELTAALGEALVVKAPHQGSSIGISIVRNADEATFAAAVNRAFFRQEITRVEWQEYAEDRKHQFVQHLADIRSGIGLPVQLGEGGPVVHHPAELLTAIDGHFAQGGTGAHPLVLISLTDAEAGVLIEAFVAGREFSCIVVETPDGAPLALPPTEIVKGTEVFDYRSKYLPGMARKVTPMPLPDDDLQRVRERCEELFRAFQFSVYARLDGFYTSDGDIFLNDPNTTSGMLPASFFFHQAAEIGLNPAQLISYIIRTSLAARAREGKRVAARRAMLARLDDALRQQRQRAGQRTRVAVVLGGYSSERHISVESGRNIYEKLASSPRYEPVPVFLTGDSQQFRLHVLPVNLLLKDNADDIRDQILAHEAGHGHAPILDRIAAEARAITETFAGKPLRDPRLISLEELAQEVSAVFIALHGRPGEDGALQTELERVGLPYNGSGPAASAVTINKFVTNEILHEAGIRVARHALVSRTAWETDAEQFYTGIERDFPYPLIAKPADDGCSSAVKKINTRAQLEAFCRLIFRDTEDLLPADAATLSLALREEFPVKDSFVIEDLIGPDGAVHFLEVTGGLLTHRQANGVIAYELFEASEALATGAVLSLEEKFLAGEGQNITPARYSPDSAERQRISDEVKRELERVARVLNVEGYARIDAFVRVRETGAVEVIVIEVNSLPGMTPATCIFHQTALAGYTPYEFIDRILTYGQKRSEERGVGSEANRIVN